MRRDPRGDIDGSPRRLWVQFEPIRLPGAVEGRRFSLIGNPPPRVFGVTGLDAADCWNIVRGSLPDKQLPAIRTIVWDVDVSSLDVWPTLIGNAAQLGVWYCAPY